MSERKILSFDELVSDPDIRYDNVQTPRGDVKIGSVSSADILEWFSENDDKDKSKYAGLRLAVKSIINPDGSRIPEERRTAAVNALAQRDARENGVLVSACLVLNGLRKKAVAEAKNELSETVSGTSPSVSPAP